MAYSQMSVRASKNLRHRPNLASVGGDNAALSATDVWPLITLTKAQQHGPTSALFAVTAIK
jgi:hypothetical protein